MIGVIRAIVYPISQADPMRSFIDVDRTFGSQPVRLGARLARIDVGRGREGLYRDQLSREPPPTTGRVVLVFAGGDAAPSPDHAPEMLGEVPSARSDPGEGGVEPFAVRQGRRATRAQRRPSGADEPFDDPLAEPFPRHSGRPVVDGASDD